MKSFKDVSFIAKLALAEQVALKFKDLIKNDGFIRPKEVAAMFDPSVLTPPWTDHHFPASRVVRQLVGMANSYCQFSNIDGDKDIKTVISVVMTEKDGITPCKGFRYPYNRVLKGNKQALWQDLTPDEKKAEAIRIREELKKIL